MPHISINGAGGPLSISYTISTPASPSAKAVDPALPTVVLLHALHMGQHSFHRQFNDAQLRRFNLVALDYRGHGDSEGSIKETYGVAEAADDVVQFLDALRLPPVHLVGVSMGSLVALELANTWPQRVISLSLVAPPAMLEFLWLPGVAEGRREIFSCWVAAFQDTDLSGQTDETALLDAVCGVLQLGVNNMPDPMLAACASLLNSPLSLATRPRRLLMRHSLPLAIRRLAVPPEHRDCYQISVAFFTERTRPTLSGIACPVQLIHCGEDIAYTEEHTVELLDALRAAGVDARMHAVPDAPQWGNITHSAQINPLIYDMVMECAPERNIPPALKTSVVSPFEAALVAAGMPQDDDSDSDGL
ncbi:Alpha/Beta hydrolase protein [Mycena belliarum]|uniref:Alpha/Beta hydrolase protein n=1 Tax=Mycena belliarum TaxID=1033014 RepID=A0AAD6TUQ4_9AGAR|nr:Alpha/Beta hydrolase protein [Mycena belliae]